MTHFATAIITAVCCIGIGASGREPKPEVPPLTRHTFESQHMGTQFRVVLYTRERPTAEAAAKAAFARVAELDSIMSDYNSKSELMQLCLANDMAPGRAVPVSPDLFAVLHTGQGVARDSDGAFDMTIGPMVKLWRLSRRTQRLPETAELERAKSLVGYSMMTLDAKARTVTLAKPGMRLDLGGIAKGYAADEVLTLLKRKFNLSQVLIAAAGDITCGDAPSDAPAWVVDIAPLSKNQKPRTLKLVNQSVSTSGDLEQFVEIGGVRYSHILDPKTGLGLTGRRSVTVIAPRGVQADSLTKTASLMPPARALALIESIPGAATYIVTKVSESSPEAVTASKRFADFLARD